jgi:hypothetical protein
LLGQFWSNGERGCGYRDWLARFDLTFSPCPFIFLVLTLFLYIIFRTLLYYKIVLSDRKRGRNRLSCLGKSQI